jgi:hypothetical protein
MWLGISLMESFIVHMFQLCDYFQESKDISHTASPEIPFPLWNREIYCRVHRSPHNKL